MGSEFVVGATVIFEALVLNPKTKQPENAADGAKIWVKDAYGTAPVAAADMTPGAVGLYTFHWDTAGVPARDYTALVVAKDGANSSYGQWRGTLTPGA